MCEEACTKSELEIFRPVDLQIALSDGRWQSYQPINSLTNAEILEFVIPGTSNETLDLEKCSLYLKFKIKNLDGSEIAVDDTVMPVNNFFGSLFKNIEVNLNGQLITRPTRDLPYKDYLWRVSSWDMPGGANGNLQNRLIGFYKDTPGKADVKADNAAGKKRASWISESKSIELRGRPCIDLFDTDRHLLMNSDMQIKFYLNDPSFFLLHPKAATNRYKVIFEEATLYVRRVTVGDSFVNEINTTLKSKDAIYPFTRREVNVITLPKGIMQHTYENLSRGILPTNIYIAMVEDKAYAGDYSRSPYNFKHFDVSEIGVYENGTPIAQETLRLDFKENSSVVNAYYLLLESIGGIGDRALSCPIDFTDFVDGSTIFCFSRSPDLSARVGQIPTQSGNLTLKLRFHKALPEAVAVVVMMEYDARIQINQYKNIITDYAI